MRLAIGAAVLLLCCGLVSAAPKLREYKDGKEASDAAKELGSMNGNSRKALFQQWKQNNGKDYADNSAADRAAFAAWSDNLDAVVEHNKKSGVKFFKGLSAYSDLTFAEFKDKWLMPDRPVSDIPVVPSAKKFSPGGSRKLKQTPPLEFDWRARGVVPPARNQGGCGACWAFAGLGAMEIKARIDGTQLNPDLSEQQIVDCAGGGVGANGFGSYGCNGGWSNDAYGYVAKLQAVKETAYPYTGVTGTCRDTSVSLDGSLTMTAQPGFQGVINSAQAIMQAVSSTGPVSHYFNVQDSFYYYSGGIYQASQCTADTYNHAMIIVGYNATAGIGSPDSYFIVRNSWGNWGVDGGYIKPSSVSSTIASAPHSLINGYKNVLAVAVETDYSFPLAEKVKAYLADPFAFASTDAPAAGSGDAPAAAAAAAPEEEEEDEDMGFSLFD
ncbi:hypothetical protein D9Q98_006640 [Chlorella vulgaris]|uniref:Uncharacterized protein n=1 Tax=Chlorella vulgaris TaxID=3077 RepID=A0A9D4YVA2_CHLVU|nr:hypothetical protein D9Q98_006640 [Chlorella vulgaris]